MAEIDPVTLSTVWHFLQRTCQEMRQIMFRTSPNFLTAELHDISVGIWDAQGRTKAIPEGLPGQFIGGKFGIQIILDQFSGKIYPGDVFLTNDPYRGGALHLPDWGFIRPIFYKDELVFFTLARSHQVDTGGSFPGGYFPDAYDIIAEGINIPPLKVVEKGQEKTDLFQLIWSNTRMPELVRADNYALMGSTKISERRLHELLDKYGKDTVLACLEEMMDRSEKAVRAEIAKIPDGTYYGESAADDDGSVLDVPVWVRLNLTVKGDEMTFDFSPSDPQTRGFINSAIANTYGNSIALSFVFMNPALSEYHNEGSMKPITIIAPEGSVVNAQFPAILGASPVTVGCQIGEAVATALSKALPHKAIAHWGRHYSHFIYGEDPRTNRFYISVSFNMDGGAGAVYGYDGRPQGNQIHSAGAACKSDIEEEEIRFPLRYTRYELATDTCGSGKWRGAPGIYWEVINEGKEATMSTGNADGETTRGEGVLGGYPCPYSKSYVTRGTERIPIRLHRMYKLLPGDILTKISGGGAGVGNPIEREPEKVREDVITEFISIKTAREDYKVVMDPKTLEIDYKATKALRGG